jgi:hypothetical protein
VVCLFIIMRLWLRPWNRPEKSSQKKWYVYL